MILSNYLLSKVHYELSYSLTNSEGDFFNNNLLSNLFSLQKNQWLKVQSSLQLLQAELAIYSKELGITFKSKGTYSSYKFANLINDEAIRNNLSTNQSLTLSVKSGYIKSFNFYQAFTIEQSDFQNQFTDFKNTLYKNELQLYYVKNIHHLIQCN